MPPTKSLTLVLGGARSGKSSLAEKLATRYADGQQVLYVATAEAHDAEMAERIRRHRQTRPGDWLTLEAPLHITQSLSVLLETNQVGVILLDCLTLLASNYLLAAELASSENWQPEAEADLRSELEALVTFTRHHSISLIIVSNEVGLGLVPEYRLGRAYRDMLGRLNQYLAAEAEAVYFMIAGLVLDAKALAVNPLV